MDILQVIKDGLVIYGGYKALSEVCLQGKAALSKRVADTFEDVPALTSAFFGEQIQPGDLVRVTGRYSRFGYTHTPRMMYEGPLGRRSISEPTDKHRQEGSYRLFEINASGSKREFYGAAVFPPCPMTPSVLSFF